MEDENLQDKQTILIAEDEEFNYFFLETLINDILKLNCTILHAINGEEAVKYCKNNTAIDLVLMDIKMPVMDGYEATKQIKELYPNLIVVAQTSYSTPEDRKKALSSGFDDFLAKPIGINTFKLMIDRYLNDTVDAAISSNDKIPLNL